MNYPAPRDIPAGKTLIGEYRDPDVKANVATRETVAEKRVSDRVGWYGRPKIRLVWSSPGFEIAGSCMRWTNGFWAVLWDDRSGSTHGSRFAPTEEGEAKARAKFANLTE